MSNFESLTPKFGHEIRPFAEVRVDFIIDWKTLYHPAYFFLGNDLKGYRTKQFQALTSHENWFIEGSGEIKSSKEAQETTSSTSSNLNSLKLSDTSIDSRIEHSYINTPRSAKIGIGYANNLNCGDLDKGPRDRDLAMFVRRAINADKKKKVRICT